MDRQHTIIRESAVQEPEIEVQLTSLSDTMKERVRYCYRTGHYEPLPELEMTDELLNLQSHTILKEDFQRLQDEKRANEFVPKDLALLTREEEEEFEGVISKEELRKLDSQPNPFNFSERVTQTSKVVSTNVAIQTDPPPSTTFSGNVGLGNIYDAYQEDFEKVVKKELEKEMEKEREKESRTFTAVKLAPKQPLPAAEIKTEPQMLYGEKISDMDKLVVAARTLERMVSQNIYDEITQDFKYWEDGSDEFRPLEGSLLPLWRFSHELSRRMTVSSVSWSPAYPDLFATSYKSCDVSGTEGEGMLCLFTLKNPSAPERIVMSEAGVTSVQFHPRLSSVLCAGRIDGNVVVYDVKSASNPVEIISNAISGKHLLPVCQVQWIQTEPGEELSFFSVSVDGRVTQWYVHASALIHSDLLDFKLQPKIGSSSTRSNFADKVTLEGCGTCIAFKPDDESIFLVGCDTGVIIHCTTASTTYDLTKYDAHCAPVRAVKWNPFSYKVFVSCSIDWTVKIWVEFFLSPLVVLDIGGPVASVAWSPGSSTVLVATTDEGKIDVFDLDLRRCRPLCVQNVVQKRKVTLTSLAFSPFFPVILVGGNKGYLVAFKLSPNLRKVHKDARGADEQRQREVEIDKMDRLVAISQGFPSCLFMTISPI